MLENLEKIDWNSIHHAYGVASDIPPLIRALISPQQEKRQIAIEELDNLINHQETLYEASVYVAPFLVELINNPITPDKDMIAASFAMLAKDISQRKYSDKELQWAISLRSIVEQNISILYSFLKSSDASVRWVIARVLAVFPDHKSTILPLLEQAFAVETHQEVKKDIGKVIQTLKSINE